MAETARTAEIEIESAETESLAPAVTRAGAILELLAEDAGQAVGPSELARRLGLPKSSIANICNALADIGLVRRIGTGFALGRKLAELGGAYLAAVQASDIDGDRPGVDAGHPGTGCRLRRTLGPRRRRHRN